MADPGFELKAQIFGDKETVRKLSGFPAVLRKRLAMTIHSAGREVARDVASVEWGGSVFQRRSGRVQRSIKARARETAEYVSSLVSSWGAPAFWILGQGVKKNETWVKPFTRRMRQMDTYAIKRSRDGGHRLTSAGVQYVTGKRIKGRKVASGQAQGSGFPRKVRRAGRPTMPFAYERNKGQIERRMKGAVEAATQEFNASGSDFDGAGVG